MNEFNERLYCTKGSATKAIYVVWCSHFALAALGHITPVGRLTACMRLPCVTLADCQTWLPAWLFKHAVPFQLPLRQKSAILCTMLATLPTEIQHHIVLNLHPSAAIALLQTNHWFHDHVSLYRLDQDLVHDYLRYLEHRDHNEDNRACYNCLTIKPRSGFTSGQLISKKAFCLDCGVRTKMFEPYSLIHLAGGEEPRLFCGSCCTVQRSFCRQCRLCNGCIVKMGTWTGRASQQRLKQPDWFSGRRGVLCPKHEEEQLRVRRWG